MVFFTTYYYYYFSRRKKKKKKKKKAPGAVDNGSGTVGMIEMARVLSQSQVEFENTIRICVWTGEEQVFFFLFL